MFMEPTRILYWTKLLHLMLMESQEGPGHVVELERARKRSHTYGYYFWFNFRYIVCCANTDSRSAGKHIETFKVLQNRHNFWEKKIQSVGDGSISLWTVTKTRPSHFSGKSWTRCRNTLEYNLTRKILENSVKLIESYGSEFVHIVCVVLSQFHRCFSWL